MIRLETIDQCRIGLYEKALPSAMSFEERLTTAHKAGYQFLEISIDETDERMSRLHWTDRQKSDIQAAERNSGLGIRTMCLSGNRRYPIGSEDPKIRAKGVQLIRDAIAFSDEMGIRIIQLASYDDYYLPRNANTERLFSESLLEVAWLAQKHGVTLAFENMDTSFIDSIEKAMRHVKFVNSPFLQIYPDVGNLVGNGFSTEQIRRDFLSGIGHVVAIHLKDARRGEIRKVKYGEGIVDFVDFFSLLRNIRYPGLFVAEMWSDESEGSIAYVETAMKFLRLKIEESASKKEKQCL